MSIAEIQTTHPLAPTRAEVDVITRAQARLEDVLAEQPVGFPHADDPDVAEGLATMSSWSRRTCPDWCSRDHGVPPLVPSVSIFHQHTVASRETSQAWQRSVSVQLGLEYDDQAIAAGELTEVPTVRVELTDDAIALTPEEARWLAGQLVQAADLLESSHG